MKATVLALLLALAPPAAPATAQARVELCDIPGWRQYEKTVQLLPSGQQWAVFQRTLTGTYFLKVLSPEGAPVAADAQIFFLNAGAGIVVEVQGPPGETVRVFLCMRSY